MAAVGMACGNGEAVSSSTEDLTSKYRSEAASQEDVPIEEAFAISYLDFSLQLLRDSRTSGEQKKRRAERKIRLPGEAIPWYPLFPC